MTNQLVSDLSKRMDGALEALKKEFAGLRTGRASTSLLEPVVVEAYGSKMPISQLASVNAIDARTLSVQVWDAGLASSVEKGIRDSDLGLNPQREGNVIRINLPDLSEERRKELVKVAGKYAEQSRISIRNIRRDGMDAIKAQEKKKEISEDELKRLSDAIQKTTDDHIKKIDEMLQHKEADILKV